MTEPRRLLQRLLEYIEEQAKEIDPRGYCLSQAKGFVLGLQWHPEWRWRENPISRQIFSAFAAAVKEYAARR